MTTKVVPGVLIATPDAELAAREAATRTARAIRDAIGTRGRAAVALSGGSTPRATYALLARDAKIDWTRVDVFFVDERAVPPSSDRSNYRMVKEALLDPAKIPEDRVHRMRAESMDRDDAAREYEALLRRHVRQELSSTSAAEDPTPSLDLIVLGVGDDGHTASLFPGRPEVDVTSHLVVAVPSHRGLEPRLTFTPPIIEAARHVMILALGKGKNDPLERVWRVAGDVHETPARIIRGVRGAVSWIIDRAAGGMG
jgi:6-phosphogluconolactonase